jgi:surface carbohydrate biosynthesis protein (TIGR04326 family)
VSELTSVIVWDQKSDPPHFAGGVFCWRSYDQQGVVISIPRYLEDHAERIRGKYVAFIHDLGDRKISGKRLVDHFDMGEGFSFWWMTHLAEKSPFKSPRIYDCLRLIALEEILLSRHPDELTLVSVDAVLVQALRGLCRNLKIRFCRERGSLDRVGWSLRKVYDALPYPLRGLVSLRHFVARWPLRKLREKRWFAGPKAICVFSCYVHLDPILCAQGRFRSRQWEELPEILRDSGRRINWIQLFMRSQEAPDAKAGLSQLQRFNSDADHQGWHVFLESHLTVRNLVLAIGKWLQIQVVTWGLSDVQAAFYPKDSAVWLWPMLRADWKSSFAGPAAMSGCLYLALFDAALSHMPRQSLGLFLYENQAWEKALLRAWRRYKHGEIIGVQHATVPFWHLYYVDDKRSLDQRNICAMPLPDRLAVNGSAALGSFVSTGYPVDRLVETEALRYINLRPLAAKCALRVDENDGLVRTARSNDLRVLILGDMIPVSMQRLLVLLEEAVESLPQGYAFKLKPHPGYPIDPSVNRRINAEKISESLATILDQHDVVVAANSTSAAVDAYVAGVPVLIRRDGDQLNLSPLRGHYGACFFGTAQELVAALKEIKVCAGRPTASTHEEFFFLDADLARWKRLLTSSALK